MKVLISLLKAGLALLLLWWQASYLLTGELWQILLAILLCALPLALFWMQQATVQKNLQRLQFKSQGYLFRLFSGRFISLMFAISASLLAAIFLLIHLHTFSRSEWQLLFLSAPIYIFIYYFLLKLLASEYKSYLLQGVCLRFSALLSPIFLALVLLFIPYFSGGNSDPSITALSVGEFVSEERSAVLDLDKSAAIQELALLQQTWSGVKSFALLGEGSSPIWLIKVASLVENWLFYYLVCSLIAAFLLTGTELRRSLGPLTDAEQVPPLKPLRVMLISGICSFIILFVFIPLSAYLELWARGQQPVIRSAETQLVLELEQIGDAWYRPGTWNNLQDLRAQVIQDLDISLDTLTGEIDQAYSLMGNNVDYFLDWYYSLGGEYARIANLMTGNLETYLASKLTESLQRGDVFAKFENNFSSALANQEELQTRYLQSAESILAANQVRPGDVAVTPLRQLSLTDVFTPPVHDEFIHLQSRLALSAGGGTTAGLMSSLVAAKLSSRLLAKGSFKLAAKALGKVIASKAGGATAGAGAGAAAGAAAGSIIPGLGTAVGAVLGGIVGGVATGLAIDKALIEFEEALSRDEFKEELLLALEESRKEFMLGIQE